MNNEILYHDDEYPVKRPLSQEEVDFLTNLQKEMNTQNHLATADPRIWVIKDYRRCYGKDLTYADGYCLYSAKYNKEIMSYESEKTLLKETKDYLIKMCPEKFSESDFPSDSLDRTDIITALKNKDVHHIELLEYKEIIVTSQTFFSQKAAEDYLKEFHYRFTKNAHTYCDCALNNNEMTQLVKILHEADFQLLLNQ